MKKLFYSLASLLILVCIVVACNKDQKVVKQLDGKWKVTSQSVNGVEQPAHDLDDDEISFSECKVKNGDCDGTITDSVFVLPFKYSISEKGEKITMTYNVLGTNFTDVGTIEEHSKSKFVFTVTGSGRTVKTSLEKK